MLSKIEENLIDLTSEDYNNFIKKTQNIECDKNNLFETDYGNYSIICVAKSDKDLTEDNLILKDVYACYNKKRSRVTVTNKKDKEIYIRLNKIAGIHSYLNKEEFKCINVTKSSTIMTGDNWYIIIDDNKIIDYRLIKEDKFACLEFMQSLNSIYGENSCDLSTYVFDEKIKTIKK